MPMIDFYHYTSKEHKDAILKSGVIKASQKTFGDAVYGDGVYGTTLNPELVSKAQVAANNYDNSRDNWMEAVNAGKVDFAFRLKIRSKDVVKITHSNRKILLYKGDLKLGDFDFKVIKVPDTVGDIAEDIVNDETDDSDDDEDLDVLLRNTARLTSKLVSMIMLTVIESMSQELDESDESDNGDDSSITNGSDN